MNRKGKVPKIENPVLHKYLIDRCNRYKMALEKIARLPDGIFKLRSPEYPQGLYPQDIAKQALEDKIKEEQKEERKTDCPYCNGTGRSFYGLEGQCTFCQGSGKKVCGQEKFLNGCTDKCTLPTMQVCILCNGSGRIKDGMSNTSDAYRICPQCFGQTPTSPASEEIGQMRSRTSTELTPEQKIEKDRLFNEYMADQRKEKLELSASEPIEKLKGDWVTDEQRFDRVCQKIDEIITRLNTKGGKSE